MSEIRIDPFSGRQVIVGTRVMRKNVKDFITPQFAKKEGPCPFCGGQENKTLPEVFALRDKDSKPNDTGWKVRVIPHRWPVLSINEKGIHEIVVESPLHIVHIGDLKPERIVDVLKVYQLRIKKIYLHNFIKYVHIFKNQEEAACISMFHIHSQIIGMPVLPPDIEKELDIASNYTADKKSCLYCDTIKDELRKKERIVEETDNFVSIVPYAPRFPFETHIYPKKHIAAFEKHPFNEFLQLAHILKSSIMKICLLFDNPPLNYSIHTVPLHYKKKNCYHWHIEIYPHPNSLGGFEWGGGSFINPPMPEEAAMLLRNTDIGNAE